MGNQNGKVAAAPVDMSIIETSLRASITAAIETKFTTITASLDLLTDQINELAATSKANTGALTVSIDNLRTSIPTHPTLTSSNLKHHTKSFQEDISPLDISAPPLHKAGSSNISDPEWDAATSPRDDDSGDAIADADALADITLSFNAQTASYICKSLNAVAGEIPVVGAIVELMGTVFEKIDEAQSNKEACENLGVRIFELGIALTSLLKKGHSHDNDVAMAGPLRTLHNQLVETAEFIATFSNRGWLQKMFWAKYDTDEFDDLDKKLTQTVTDAHFQMNVGMMQLQQKSYAKSQENQRHLMEKLNLLLSEGKTTNSTGAAPTMKEIALNKKLTMKVANAFNVGVEEIQGEVNYEAAVAVERQYKEEHSSLSGASDPTSDPPSDPLDPTSPAPSGRKHSLISTRVLMHRGFRVFWQSRIYPRVSASTAEFQSHLRSHMQHDLNLPPDLIDELTTGPAWATIIAVCDADGDGHVSLMEMRKTFNNVRMSSKRNSDLVSGLRAICRSNHSGRRGSAACLTDVKNIKHETEYVGRSAEQYVLIKGLLSVSQSDNFHACEVSGEAGVGKTSFVRKVSENMLIKEFYKGGIFTISLDESGCDVQRSAQTKQEVATAVLTALNTSVSEMVGSITSKVKSLFNPCKVLTSVLTNLDLSNQRVLMIFENFDSDTPEQVYTEIARITNFATVSAIFATDAPLVNDEIKIASRIMLEPVSQRVASKILWNANKSLSSKKRKRLVKLAQGLPEVLVTLANAPDAVISDYQRRQNASSESTPASPYKRDGSSKPARPLSAYGSSNNESELVELFSATGDSETLVNVYREAQAVGFETDLTIEELRQNSYAADLLHLQRRSTQKLESLDEARGGSEENLSVHTGRHTTHIHTRTHTPPNVERGSSEPQQRLNGGLDVSPTMTDLNRGGSLDQLTTPKNRDLVFSLFAASGREGDLAMATLGTMGVVAVALLSIFSLVPTTFNFDFANFCWDNRQKFYSSPVTMEECLYSSSKEFFKMARRNGWIEASKSDCTRFSVKKKLKSALLRRLITKKEVLKACRGYMGAFYLRNLSDLGEQCEANPDPESFENSAACVLFDEERANMVHILRLGKKLKENTWLSTMVVSVFDSSKEFINGRVEEGAFNWIVRSVDELRAVGGGEGGKEVVVSLEGRGRWESGDAG